nr:hypothetical protein [Candidatus Sigynarchaeota archaeon]
MNPEYKSPYVRFRRYSVSLFKISYAFLFLFTIAYGIVVPAAALAEGILNPWESFFDMLLGISICAIFLFFYGIAHTRIGALTTLVAFAYWWFVVGKEVIRNDEILERGFTTAYATIGLPWIWLLAISFLGLVNFLGETVNLCQQKRSWSLGPWFHGFRHGFGLIARGLDAKQKRSIKKALIGFTITVGVIIPGALMLSDAFSPRIEIRPQHYDITYNFWATPPIYANYTDSIYIALGLGPRLYSEAALDQFEKHHVNLDLTFDTITNDSLQTLLLWESRCPSVTYRVTMYPSSLLTFVQHVQTATEFLTTWEANHVIHNWRGFCFDIEGDPYNSFYANLTFSEATAIWNSLFDYMDQKSAERGKTIEMECVSGVTECADVPFDGDNDMQAEGGFNMYIPQRFTMYAPMIYRCGTGGETPWGSPMDPEHPWDTSYSVYSQLDFLNRSVPAGKTGFYIGITNLSCYGRDMPQPEPYTWPAGNNSGFSNLMRDVLIAKHFGIKEITFFLAWTVIDPGNYSMGGVFESYGTDFLDQVNLTVYTNPPERFDIFYRQSDARGADRFRLDWLFDTNRLKGIAEIIAFWIVAVSIVVIYPKYKKSRRKGQPPSVIQKI